MRRCLAVLVVLATAAPARADDAPPPAPVLVPDVCPLDRCAFGTWTATKPLTAYAAQGQATKVAFTLKPGQRFLALKGNVHTFKPAKLRIHETFTWPPGSKNPFERYTAGSVMWVLAPRGDKYLDVWYRGRRRGIRAAVGKGRWFMPGRDLAQELEAGDWTWWVEVEGPGKKRGWLTFPNLEVDGIKELVR